MVIEPKTAELLQIEVKDQRRSMKDTDVGSETDAVVIAWSRFCPAPRRSPPSGCVP
jgi:hypothetical protein